ncbi:antibiotic biosynthesis monooxygenase [Bradyrhizobium sp. AUGA SZCCT0182]|uniref:antibiotic biosynthesis monooxygenase family protein n=1 Tax=Bradyrhizobium sp. AUGA SZCCT0182 TaxID=2807667 RepID=UPI001BADCB41|nr:antibiotic biosynthesis monooxygenase [Bradyrhizobium sp. AUGA SZCCT0182]
MLDEATDKVMKRQPGFVSANIQRSLSGKHVANYAQWRSKEYFEAMQRNPECKEHMMAAGKARGKIRARALCGGQHPRLARRARAGLQLHKRKPRSGEAGLSDGDECLGTTHP